MLVLFVLAVFLIVLILIQRGKGGGLAGALGGMGGQSAFGTKAGDLFTKITIGVAAVWIILCVLSVHLLSSTHSRIDVGDTPATGSTQGENPTAPMPPDDAGKEKGATGAQPSSETPATPDASKSAPAAPAAPSGGAPASK
jgi:preprotein translocase subunit SecG